MKLNHRNTAPRTHEGGVAAHIGPLEQLKRTVMSCMLWENNFYEDGKTVAERFGELVAANEPEHVALIAEDARSVGKLRHAPLLLVREMARLDTHKHLVAQTLHNVIQRPDELTEFLAMYWKDEKQPISAQVKRGLASAFTKFDEYSLAKYNRDNAIKLRDVLFLSHAKPNDELQAALWKRLIDGTLDTPDTWEVELSASINKLASWTRLLAENKLGALALLRNIRNMTSAGISSVEIGAALQRMKVDRVLPFRFITAQRYAPELTTYLEEAMLKCLIGTAPLKGKTLLLIDRSGSMNAPLSQKSEMTRVDAACGLAVLAREICQSSEVVAFSTHLSAVPEARGFALAKGIRDARSSGGTSLGACIREAALRYKYDRLIVFTDEQSQDRVDQPNVEKAYMVNVASERNGVGYGEWRHIDGFSENILRYIVATEEFDEI